MELSALVRLIHRYAKLIAGTTVAAMVMSGAVTLMLPPTYLAEARLVIGPASTNDVTDYNQLLSAQALARTYAEAATTNAMAERVIDRLGLTETPEKLRERISAQTERESSILVIAVKDPTAEGAAAIANDIGDDLVASAAAIQGRDPEVTTLVREQITGLRDQITDLDARIEALRAIEDASPAEVAELERLQEQTVTSRQTLATLLSSTAVTMVNGVSFLDRAVAPPQPVGGLIVNVLIAAVLGLITGLAAAVVINALDDTVRSGVDVAAGLQLPILGSVRAIPVGRGREPYHRVAMLTHAWGQAAEAIRAVRTNVEFAGRGREMKVLLITSPGPAEGKTVVATNLAIAFAQAGRRTILVDADLRSPFVHEMLRLPNTRGLSDWYRAVPVKLSALVSETDVTGLSVLTSGPQPTNPADLLGTAWSQLLLTELRASFEVVVLDTPPVGSVTDAALLAGLADGVILVVAPNRTRRAAAVHANELLQRVGAPVIGMVVNDRDGTGSDPALGQKAYPPALAKARINRS